MVFLTFIFLILPFSILDYGKKSFNVIVLQRYLFLCCLIYFIVVAGGRYYPGTGDWDSYRNIFLASGRIGNLFLFGYFEPGFELLINIIKTFTNVFNVFLLINELIVCVFLYYNIKIYLGNPISVCCLYFPIIFLTLDMIQIRSLLAVQIFVFSMQFIRKRKLIPYCLCIFCASMVHISSLILFPLYFVLHKKYKSNTLFFIVIIGILINILRIDVFIPLVRIFAPLMGGTISNRVAFYLSGTNLQRRIGFIHLEYLVFFPLIIRYRKKLEEYDINSNIFINMFILYGIAIFYLWSFSVFSGRIKFFFIFSMLFLIPRLIKINKKIFLFVFFCFLGYVLAMVIYVLYFQSGLGASGFFSNYVNYFFM